MTRGRPRLALDVSEIIALYRDGNSVARIGGLLGCSYETIRNVLLRAKEPMRRRGPPTHDMQPFASREEARA